MENKTNSTHFGGSAEFRFVSGSRLQARYGRFVANKYAGNYASRDLQSKADSGLWYCHATGTGIGLEGEGSTPEAALSDLRARAAAMRDELARVYCV